MEQGRKEESWTRNKDPVVCVRRKAMMSGVLIIN